MHPHFLFLIFPDGFSDIEEVTENIEKTFDLRMVSDLENLGKHTFKWDRHCPQIMAFHSSMRGKLARSQFVKTHLLVVQVIINFVQGVC